METVWANALLSDGKLLFWYTGSKCDTWQDFYKDFYYAGYDIDNYVCNHFVVLKQIAFYDENYDEQGFCEYNNFYFEVLAKEFYKLFELSPDAKGERPY